MRNPHLDGDAFFWEGGPTGILLFHGFTATTAEVRLLGRFLHEHGYTVSGPLLPGHGTTPEEMNHCRWQDWVAAAEAAYRQLASRCEHVFIGGESMGAAISLYLASEYPEAYGILAYAPGILFPPFRMWMARLLSLFVTLRRKPQGPPTAVDSRWKGYGVNPLHAVLELDRLQSETRKQLPRIHQPLLIVQGRLDRTIDPRSGDIIRREVSSELKEFVWLENSTHCIILDCEWDKAAALTLKFIQKVEPQHN
ncbi:MAG TPA: alpha/beta fold hydrolase [Anaerolineae bacterium]